MWLSWPWLCSLHITETAALTWDWFHGSSFLMELAWGWSHDIIRDPEREREKTCQSPWHLDVKPTHHHFCHICWAKQVTRTAQTQREGEWTTYLNGRGCWVQLQRVWSQEECNQFVIYYKLTLMRSQLLGLLTSMQHLPPCRRLQHSWAKSFHRRN